MIRFFVLFFIFNVSVSSSVHAIGGPAQTKRERLAAERGRGVVPDTPTKPASTGLREEIERSFLFEDYTAAERLSREYLAGSISEEDRREVEYLRALCFLKLRRGIEARVILENLAGRANSVREHERILASINKTKPRV